jgi:hypothetical protein
MSGANGGIRLRGTVRARPRVGGLRAPVRPTAAERIAAGTTYDDSVPW